MFLERKKEAEIAERKGTTKRTVIQSIWLLITLAGAIAVTELILLGGSEPLLNINIFTSLLRDTFVPFEYHALVVKGAIALIVMIIMQLLFMVAYMFGSKEGRQKAGQASATSKGKDPYEREW